MDQNEPKDKNGNLNEKKLPGDPVSLYIVSFSGTEQDLSKKSDLFQPVTESGNEIFSHGFDDNHVRRAFVRKGIGSTLLDLYIG